MMTDPIADMLTRIRNALRNTQASCAVPGSRMKVGVLDVLKREGFIRGYEVHSDGPKSFIHVHLGYGPEGEQVITSLDHFSKPGCRRYRGAGELPVVRGGLGIAVGGADNVLVTGFFQGTVDFGGGALSSAGNSDVFLAKYDAAGAHLWSQRFGDTGVDVGRAIAVDGAGNVLVTGILRGTVDFGGGPLTSAGLSDIFVAKFGVIFLRGDANADGRQNVTDAIFVLRYLFGVGEVPPCAKSADADDSGTVDRTDPIFLLNFLFTRGPSPLAPFPECGPDPTDDDLTCESFQGCE